MKLANGFLGADYRLGSLFYVAVPHRGSQVAKVLVYTIEGSQEPK
jgi:hypothetical protein